MGSIKSIGMGLSGIGLALAVHSGVAGGLPQNACVDLGGGMTMKFVLIPVGSFFMGSDEEIGEADETPRHKVTLTRPFYLGKFEVTQEQWQRIMGSNPSAFHGPNLPVDTVSWNDCQLFIAKLGKKTNRRFALPTEAQWEYAARSGTSTKWSFGDTDVSASNYSWIEADSEGTTHAVGEKKPNAWGIHDLYGNVGEWCGDWYENPYPRGDVIDPQGPSSGDSRVIRGGAWGDHSSSARSAYRNCNGPEKSHNGVGFRCVMEADEANAPQIRLKNED